MQLTALNPTAISQPTTAAAQNTEKQRRIIRDACQEFEGFFMGILLKEGFNPMLNQSEDSPPGQETAMHMALEHTAREMGRQGSLGIADVLYEQLSGLL